MVEHSQPCLSFLPETITEVLLPLAVPIHRSGPTPS